MNMKRLFTGKIVGWFAVLAMSSYWSVYNLKALLTLEKENED